MLASSHGSRLRYLLRCSFCTSEMDSTPPPTVTAMESTRICLAAVATAIRPEEHCRSMVCPGTVTGRPGAQGALAGDVEALRPLLRGGTHDDVLDQ